MMKRPILTGLAAALGLALAAHGQAFTEVNYATSGTASDTGFDFGGETQRGNDGNTDGNFNNNSVTHSNTSTEPSWWQVDLGGTKDIGRVVVYLRTDCCTDRNRDLRVTIYSDADATAKVVERVYVGNPFLATPPATNFAFNFSPAIKGRVVRVDNELAPNWLSLAEVQAIAPYAGANVTITGLSDKSVEATTSVTFGPIEFSAGSVPADKFTVEWQKNGQTLAGQTGRSLTLPLVSINDNNAEIKAIVTTSGSSSTATAKLTVTPDVTKPTITSGRGTSNRKAVTVQFSEPVDPASATATANYSVKAGAATLGVTSAALVNPTTVRLVTDKQTDGAEYTLTVNGVKDAVSPANTIAANSTVQFRAYAFQAGQVLNKFWDNFTGNIAALTNLAAFPNSPSRVRTEKAFEYPPDAGTEGGANYGNEMEAWWTAPSSGEFIFFVSSDDNAQLFLSTDDDPANAKLIALEPEWNGARQWTVTDRRPGSENRSDAYVDSQWATPNRITLAAGTRYYIRVLHQEGGGGDNVAITYSKSGGADPENGSAPIGGSELGFYYDPTDSAVSITAQPVAPSVLEGRTATFSVTATGKWQWGQAPQYQWQSAASAAGPFTDIAGATSASYTTPIVALADSGKTYRARVYVPGAQADSTPVALTVNKDSVAPRVTRVIATGSDALNVTFDERLDGVTAQQAANYQLSGGVTVIGATLTGEGGNVVILDTGSPITSGASYTLTVNGVKDQFGNTATGVAVPFTARIVTYADVILADQPIAYYRFEETSGSKAVNAGTLGSEADGIYMVADGEGTAKNQAGPTPTLGFAGFSKANKAAVFDGESDWVDTTKQLLQGLGAFSLEYWVKPLRTNDVGEVWPNRVGIVGQNDAIEYGFISPNTIQIWTPNGGSLDTTYTFPDNEWHHVATIADGTSIKNYFDGKLVGTGGGNANGNYGTSVDFTVKIGGGGVFDGSGNYFRGQIDEVAIFNKGIPADRIAAHYKAGKEGGTVSVEPARFTGITLAGGNITITWTGQGTLQSAASVSGPWTAVAGNPVSPHTTAAGAAQLYYRVVSQ